MTSESLMNVIDLYKNDLRMYGHRSLPRFYMEKSFHERIDSLLLLLCRQCSYLHTLVSKLNKLFDKYNPKLYFLDCKRENIYLYSTIIGLHSQKFAIFIYKKKFSYPSL